MSTCPPLPVTCAACAVQRSASCTFEENFCRFVQDLSRSVTVSWKRSREDDKPLETNNPPPFDHTLMTGRLT